MHDFMHDLALSTSGKECLFVDSTTINANDISETYHLCVENDDFDLEHLCANAENLSAVRKLRTFALAGSGKGNIDSLTNLECLRALAFGVDGETLPASICKLKHLRYLRIVNRVVEVLPESICQLYKLQTLDVERCENLKELPIDLWKLTNLRHLLVGKHTKMPKGFGRLEDLRELPTLVANLWEAGCEIEELQNLNRLRGRLRIYGMQNVTDAEYAEKARLKEKSNVYTLELFWDNEDDRNEGNYDEVLEAMQAPPNLTKISIEGFPGGNLPKWLTNASVLPLLVEMNLKECNGCREIPAFWRHLPCLEVLLIDKMSCVKRLGGYDENVAYQEEQRTTYDPPRLKRLSLTSMDALEDWPEDSFPHLEELIVADCPKLRIISTHFPVLKKMDIERIKGLVAVEEEEGSTAAAAYNNLTSLTSLSIVGVSKFTPFSKAFLQNNEHLEEVRIVECPRFEGFLAAPPVLRPSSLKKIDVGHCYSVTTMDLSGLTSLQTLTLDGLPSLGGLESLQPNHCPASMPIPDFTFLKHLTLYQCPALTSLDVSRCTCLEELKVFRCKNLIISISTPLPSLKELIIHRICRLVVEEAAVSSNSLIELCIEGVPEFTTLPNGFLRNHKHLKRILLVDCPKFQGFLHEDEAAKLQLISPTRIRIQNCPCVMSLDIRGWDSLEELTLMNCPGVMKPSLQGLALASLPSLQIFKIGGGFSEEELDYFPFPTCPMPSLRDLTIQGWSKLKSLPHQLQHLSTRLLDLTITHCDGLTALPDWLWNLSSLSFLKISHCNNLTHFLSTTTHHPFPPPIYLSLAHVCGTFVESVVNNLTSFSSLAIEGVPELTALPIGLLLNNKKLAKIELKSCPRFQGFLHHDEDKLQLMTGLRKLKIEDCQSVTSLNFVRCLASLKELTLMNCRGIMMSSLEGLESPESLSCLEVGGFSEELDYFPFPTRPMQSLRYLRIMGWPKLKSLPEQLQYLTSLTNLIITNFDGLIALPDWIGNFSSLWFLKIFHCKNLMHLPSKQDMQRLTLLRLLVIEDCPHLAKRCMAGGEEWCKIPDDRVIKLEIDWYWPESQEHVN